MAAGVALWAGGAHAAQNAPPLPVAKPGGVGLCWTMKLYQSMNQTLPSGPTSAAMGEVHSSSLATRFHELRERNPAPSPRMTNVAIRWPVGSVTNADIAEALNRIDFKVAKGQVRMPNGPLKTVGEHTVTVAPHTDVVVEVKVVVLGETA